MWLLLSSAFAADPVATLCPSSVAALRAAGAPRPELDVELRTFPDVPELALLSDGETWRFVHCTSPPTISAPVARRTDALGPRELPKSPIVLDLKRVLGRPAWGLVTERGDARVGDEAVGAWAYTLLTVSIGPDGPVLAGEVPLGGYRAGHPVWGEGTWVEASQDLQCPQVWGERIALLPSYPARVDPDSGVPAYRSMCEYVTGRAVRTFRGEDGLLFPPP